MTDFKQLQESFKQFRINLKDYFGVLPVDLRITLEDIQKYIERNKKYE